jgi:hypothetical protein
VSPLPVTSYPFTSQTINDNGSLDLVDIGFPTIETSRSTVKSAGIIFPTEVD